MKTTGNKFTFTHDERLKPCPFCGGTAVLINLVEDVYWVGCEQCPTRAHYGKPKDEAVALWNRRDEKQIIDGFMDLPISSSALRDIAIKKLMN